MRRVTPTQNCRLTFAFNPEHALSAVFEFFFVLVRLPIFLFLSFPPSRISKKEKKSLARHPFLSAELKIGFGFWHLFTHPTFLWGSTLFRNSVSRRPKSLVDSLLAGEVDRRTEPPLTKHQCSTPSSKTFQNTHCSDLPDALGRTFSGYNPHPESYRPLGSYFFSLGFSGPTNFHVSTRFPKTRLYSGWSGKKTNRQMWIWTKVATELPHLKQRPG